MPQPVIVAGAGPVGLTLALLLHRQGRAVQVFEAVDELKPLGVGINLLPHSVRVLYELDLATRLDQAGIRTAALHYYNKLGQRIWAEPRGLAAGYRFPQYSIHRGELQQILLEEVRRRIGPDSVRTGHRLLSWADTDNGVEATFATADGTLAVEGACLAAADGIKSTARRTLYPDEGAHTDDVGAALNAYEAERRPATAAIVLANRRNGPEQVMQMAEERAPNGFDDIEDVISRDELESIAAQYKQTAGFNVEAVNGK